MRPLNHLAIPLCVPALALAAASFSSCAVPCDQVDPTDPACIMKCADLSLSLLTNRLPKSGGRLSAQVMNRGPGDRVKATLGPGGPEVSFTLNADGSGSADVTVAQLAGIPLGALNVTLQVETQENVVCKSLTKTIHIYAPPSYTKKASVDTSASGRKPTWVQISLSHVFSTLDGSMDRGIFEYQVVDTTLQALKPRATHISFFPTSVVLDISETQTIMLTPENPSGYSLTAADLSNGGAYSPIRKLALSKTNGLALDKQNRLVAVAGEGTDGPIKVFTMPQGSQTSMPVMVSGIPPGKSPVLVGWGDMNGDKLLDLIAVHADNSFGVYLQQAGQGLVYDQTWSTGLGNAAELKGATPPAFAVGDTDQDGLDDVLIGQNNVISQLASEGDGTFSKTELLNNLPADSLGLGDVNGDAKLDLAIGQKQQSMIICYTNQGT